MTLHPNPPPPLPTMAIFLAHCCASLDEIKTKKKKGPLTVLSSLVHAKTQVRVSLKSKYYKDYHAR